TDNTPPGFTGSYSDVSLGCNPSAATITTNLGNASAIDGCGTVNITSSDGAVVSNGCDRSLTRTFTAMDACNNTATISRTVTWVADNIRPTFTGDYSTPDLGCNPAASDISNALSTATATDACGTVTITSVDGTPQSAGCNWSQKRTFTERYECNNTAT